MYYRARRKSREEMDINGGDAPTTASEKVVDWREAKR